MRIGISTSVIQRGKTGVAQYVFALTKALKNYVRQHEFTLFVLEEDLPLFDFAAPELNIVPVSEQFRSPLKNIFWHQLRLPALARRHNFDVLHIPSYRRLLGRKPCALVSTIHDLAPFHITGKYDWKRMFYGRVVVKQLARRQDEIIAISQNTADDIKRFFKIDDKKISVVYNGLDHERFFPGSKEVAQKQILQQHGIAAPFFLYLARIEHPAKNHARLIQAFNQFKTETKSDWHLVFGGSDWHGAEIVHQTIRSSPFASEIHSLGFVPENDLPALYRAAEVFVYPSLYEGFGLPPIEAMACGTPVISSKCGSLGEVVGNGALIVNPEDIAELKTQMTRLAADPSQRQEWIEAGLSRARFFNWEKTARETVAVYLRAGDRHKLSPASATLPSSEPILNQALNRHL